MEVYRESKTSEFSGITHSYTDLQNPLIKPRLEENLVQMNTEPQNSLRIAMWPIPLKIAYLTEVPGLQTRREARRTETLIENKP